MAQNKTTKPLPRGIILRNDGRYMGRVKNMGETHTVYGTTLKETQKKLDALKYELEHGLYAKESDVTVDSWFHTWLNEYKMPSVKKGTIGVYQDTYDSYICKPFGKKRLKDIRPEQIQKLYNTLFNDGYSRNTIELVSVVLSGMYKQAYKNQLIIKNPVPLATLPKFSVHKERRVLTLDEQNLFLKHATGTKYDYVYELALSTGMRSGEMCGLEWQDVDFSNRIIHVKGTLVQNRYGFYKDLPKTHSSFRDIPMLDNVYGLLKERRRKQMEQKIAIGTHWQPLDGLQNLVVTTETGRPLGKGYLNKEIAKIVKSLQEMDSEFSPLTVHTFRHTFATRCIENGMEPQVLKTILGHSKLSQTMDLYAHVLPNTKVLEMQKIANLF